MMVSPVSAKHSPCSLALASPCPSHPMPHSRGRLQDVLPYVAYFEAKASEELESDGMVEKPGPEQSQATA